MLQSLPWSEMKAGSAILTSNFSSIVVRLRGASCSRVVRRHHFSVMFGVSASGYGFLFQLRAGFGIYADFFLVCMSFLPVFLCLLAVWHWVEDPARWNGLAPVSWMGAKCNEWANRCSCMSAFVDKLAKAKSPIDKAPGLSCNLLLMIQ